MRTPGTPPYPVARGHWLVFIVSPQSAPALGSSAFQPRCRRQAAGRSGPHRPAQPPLDGQRQLRSRGDQGPRPRAPEPDLGPHPAHQRTALSTCQESLSSSVISGTLEPVSDAGSELGACWPCPGCPGSRSHSCRGNSSERLMPVLSSARCAAAIPLSAGTSRRCCTI